MVDVELEERYWYPPDGGQVWLAGYQPIDPASGRFLARDDDALRTRGVHVAGVAGAARHPEALASPTLTPGAPLVLRREPDNAFDPSAVAVDLSRGGAQLGYVPRDIAALIAPDLDAGRAWSALVLRERRPSPRDPRTGVTMLLAPGDALSLRVRA